MGTKVASSGLDSSDARMHAICDIAILCLMKHFLTWKMLLFVHIFLNGECAVFGGV